MEISILLTLFLIIISLGGTFRHGGRLCLVDKERMDAIIIPNSNLLNTSSLQAVKVLIRVLNLLNIVVLNLAPKGTQTIPIQTQNHKFEG